MSDDIIPVDKNASRDKKRISKKRRFYQIKKILNSFLTKRKEVLLYYFFRTNNFKIDTIAITSKPNSHPANNLYLSRKTLKNKLKLESQT